ncbi:MAG: hypothetical protein H3C47_15440 [Candidatus Cloacimonetes bacterium]|nr:hypothetical protein [Candidatus Cloacimonadota bacterium]
MYDFLKKSPIDFIHGVDHSRGVTSFYDEILSEIKNGKKSIFCGSKNTLVLWERLDWDSGFFGLDVFQILSVSGKHVGDIFDGISSFLNTLPKGAYVLSKVEPTSLAYVQAVSKLGFELIETRLTYVLDTEKFYPSERYNVRLATIDDISFLSNVAETTINLYDRFHADPTLPSERVDRLMRTWIEASVKTDFADGVLVVDSSEPGAFCTFKTHQSKWEKWGCRASQPVFSAVSPKFKGWYRKIISELSLYLKEFGAEKLFLVTQVTNNAVISVWEKLGYRYAKSEHIFRLVTK